MAKIPIPEKRVSGGGTANLQARNALQTVGSPQAMSPLNQSNGVMYAGHLVERGGERFQQILGRISEQSNRALVGAMEVTSTDLLGGLSAKLRTTNSEEMAYKEYSNYMQSMNEFYNKQSDWNKSALKTTFQKNMLRGKSMYETGVAQIRLKNTQQTVNNTMFQMATSLVNNEGEFSVNKLQEELANYIEPFVKEGVFSEADGKRILAENVLEGRKKAIAIYSESSNYNMLEQGIRKLENNDFGGDKVFKTKYRNVLETKKEEIRAETIKNLPALYDTSSDLTIYKREENIKHLTSMGIFDKKGEKIQLDIMKNGFPETSTPEASDKAWHIVDALSTGEDGKVISMQEAMNRFGRIKGLSERDAKILISSINGLTNIKSPLAKNKLRIFMTRIDEKFSTDINSPNYKPENRVKASQVKAMFSAFFNDNYGSMTTEKFENNYKQFEKGVLLTDADIAFTKMKDPNAERPEEEVSWWTQALESWQESAKRGWIVK